MFCGCLLDFLGGKMRFLCLTICLALCAQVPSADAADRKSLFLQQLEVLDGRAASQYKNSVRLQPDELRIPGAPGSFPAFSGNYRGQYLQVAKDAARRNGVPEDLFLRLVQQESGWNPRALSRKGAVGLAQLMPGTARYLKVNPYDPAENLEGGARYLAEQYRTFGDWRLALAAYNAGPEAVQKYGGIPPYRETQGYVRAILGS